MTTRDAANPDGPLRTAAHLLFGSGRGIASTVYGTSIARQELGILLAAAVPTVALLLGAADVRRETTAVWVALALGLATLAVEGIRYARLERFGTGATLVAVLLNLALGLSVVLLKVSIAH